MGADQSKWAAQLLLAFALAGCGNDDATDDSSPKTWHVAGGFVRDAEGRAVILRGANLAGAHKQKPYFGFHQPADFTRVSNDWGMNSIRFLIIWAAIEPEKGVYDDAYLDAVSERMDWAEAAGLNVVLDMHQDLYGEGFGGDGAPRWTCDESHYAAYTPTTPWFLNYLDPEMVACFDAFWSSSELRDHYADAWRRVAERLAEHPAVVGFDPMNEPNWGSAVPGTFDVEVLEPFYEDVTRAIRERAPNWLAFIEPFAGRNLGFKTSLVPFSLPGAVYSPHAYDNSAESGTGFDPSSRAAFIARIEQLKQEADELGAPLWIGEYGGTATSPGIDAYMDAACDGADGVSAGSEYWAYDADEGYALLDPNQNEKAILLDQVVRPYPSREAGTPLGSVWDSTTRTLTVTYRADARVHAPTEISVPPRSYPNDYQVSCEGCETEKQPGKLLVTRAPSGEPSVLTLTP
jgi:endoglycosylceramidase